MQNMLITRRFVRIKALQNLYAYAITQQAQKKEAVAQVERDFTFDIFIDEADQKESRRQEQITAVTLFCQTVIKELPLSTFVYSKDSKIEQSVRKNLFDYTQALAQNQIVLQNGFSQSKKHVYIDHLYILLLLVEWHKLAKGRPTPPNDATAALLQDQLAQHPLLEELCKHSKWISAINKENVSWVQEQDRVERWYEQLIQAVALPKAVAHLLSPDNSIPFLEYIVQSIIFKNQQVNDFFSMTDLYWDEHKRIVKQILAQTFTILATKNFAAFTLLWHNLEEKWEKETVFYSRLLQITIQNSNAYEVMIDKQATKWDSERMVLVDKLILKLALAELLNFEEVPLKVSLNEYIEIAKLYGTSKNSRFINGILEGILKGLQINSTKLLNQSCYAKKN